MSELHGAGGGLSRRCPVSALDGLAKTEKKIKRYEMIRALYNQGLTQVQISEKVGLTYSYVNHIFNGGGRY